MILPDVEAAWYQGVRTARELIRECIDGGSLQPGQRFEIEDEEGQPVLAVPFEEVVGVAF
jgi:hypothetical protein